MLKRPQQNPRARGASRRSSPRPGISLRKPLIWLRRALVLGALLGSLGLCWVYGSELVAGVMNRPIAKVSIEGGFQFIDKTEVAEIISSHINREFVQLDLQAIKRELEKHPWVSSAALTRRWPDQLLVKIEEQQPIASWGDKGFINQRGELVFVTLTDYLQSLPKLSAEDAMSEQMMQTYLALNKLLRQKSLEVKTLNCDGKRAWDLTLSNGLPVELGRNDVFAKMQRVLLVFDRELRSRVNDIARIDARYDQGVAVAWKSGAAVDREPEKKKS